MKYSKIMFSSENLVFHDTISTLELKGGFPRWYMKEAIITDRALYLYKENSDYLNDANRKCYLLTKAERCIMKGQRARIMTAERKAQIMDELPEQFEDYDSYVELQDNEGPAAQRKSKILASSSGEKAEKFVKMFNLVSSFVFFDDLVVEQRQALERADIALDEARVKLVADQKSHQRIEQWVKDYPITADENRGECFRFHSEPAKSLQPMLTILHQFFKDSVSSLSFLTNNLTDQSFQAKILPSLKEFSGLKKLTLSGNKLSTQSLDILAGLFPSCVFLTDLDLSRNLIGGNSVQRGTDSTKTIMDYFLLKFFSELAKPLMLDLSYNAISDESLHPVVKYVFANKGCQLQRLDLTYNRFTPYGSRTLLKAYAMCSMRDKMKFLYGPVSLTMENLRASTTTKEERPGGDGSLRISIKRKSNNFHGAMMIKRLPISKADQEAFAKLRREIEKMVRQDRELVTIETLRDFVRKATGPDVEYEIPRYELEVVFDMVNEKLEVAKRNQNLYQVEVLLDCLRYMNARNIPAEKEYYRLADRSQALATEIARLTNMDWADDRAMLPALFEKLREAKEIGMRGDLIDIARTLYLLAEKTLKEMRGHENAIVQSDDDEDAIYDVAEEDRPSNVFDERLDKYIDMDFKELGLTVEVEAHLGLHPYRANYLQIANLNINFVRKNLFEARRFLKDEENYAFRNIFERCSVLLSDAGMASEESLTYNLARNDKNIKLTRLIFRYRNNLDKLFPVKEDYPQPESGYAETMQNRSFPDAKEQTVRSFARLRHTYQTREERIDESLTLLKSETERTALAFHVKLLELAACSTIDDNGKFAFFTLIQELVRDFVMAKKPEKSLMAESQVDQKYNYIEYRQPAVGVPPELKNEYFVQLYRLISMKKEAYENASNYRQAGESYKNLLLVAAVLTGYFQPASIFLAQSLYNWFLDLREGAGETSSMPAQLANLFQRILNTFKRALDLPRSDSLAMSNSAESIGELAPETATATDKMCHGAAEILHWVPTFVELEALHSGSPISIKVAYPDMVSDSFVTIRIDETTTVKKLVEKAISLASTISHEPDPETFWLFSQANDADMAEADFGQEFEYPLPAEKRVLKLVAKCEANYEGRVDRPLQPLRLKVRRRLFSMMHFKRDLAAMHRHTVVLTYYQARHDHVDRGLLRDACAEADVAYFAALILKINLQSHLLTSRKSKLPLEMLQKHIRQAVPASFLGQGGKTETEWAAMCQTWFARKDFIEYSVEEAMERFISGIAMYQIFFSSHYIIQARDIGGESHSPVQLRRGTAAKAGSSGDKILHSGASSPNDPRRGSNASSGALAALRRNDDFIDPILEESGEEDQPTHLQNQIGDETDELVGPNKQARDTIIEQQFWGRIDADYIMLVVNINGVHVMDAANRGEIVAQIDYDDILYVMGQGNRLKLGFVIHSYGEENSDESQSFTDSEEHSVFMTSDDCRTEVLVAKMPGLKARAIAEDIIAYCQLTLVECTRNDLIQPTHDHHHHHHHHGSHGKGNYDSHKMSDQIHVETAHNVDVREMMDSDDLGDNMDDTLLGHVGHSSHAHAANLHHEHKHNEYHTAECAPAERFKRELRKQIGSSMHGLKDREFFCYHRKPPLLTPYVAKTDMNATCAEALNWNPENTQNTAMLTDNEPWQADDRQLPPISVQRLTSTMEPDSALKLIDRKTSLKPGDSAFHAGQGVKPPQSVPQKLEAPQPEAKPVKTADILAGFGMNESASTVSFQAAKQKKPPKHKQTRRLGDGSSDENEDSDDSSDVNAKPQEPPKMSQEFLAVQGDKAKKMALVEAKLDALPDFDDDSF